MSFLSSLFCCFDTEDTERRESSITTRHPKLTKTQSNLQKALTNKSSQPQLSIGVENNIGANNIDHNDNNNSKVTDNRVTDKSSKNKKDNRKSVHSTQHQSKNNNSRNSKNMEHSDSANSTNPGTNSTATAVDSKSQHFHEITDLKDSTDSSKDEDTINIHDYQTQNTEETKPSTPKTLSPEFDESKIITQFNGEEKNGQDDINRYKDNDAEEVEYNDDSNNNNNENDTHSQDAEMYDEDYDLDLTKIRSDQVVAASGWLLDPPPPSLKNRKCLVLDLDETLVHSSFKYVRQCDFVIPVEIENQVHNVYVIKRPGVDDFLKKCGELFEVVVFTASVSRYGDPLLDILDVHKSVHHRLFRESCYNYQGNYIKNLSQMGRPMEDLIIIDNSPASYIFHPQHSVPISSWFSDSHDCELTDLLPFLEDLANKRVDDVRLVLDVTI